MFKEIKKKQRCVWRDLNNLLSPGRETRRFLFFFLSTTKWHAVSSLSSSPSAVKPVKHVKAHCSAAHCRSHSCVYQPWSPLIKPGMSVDTTVGWSDHLTVLVKLNATIWHYLSSCSRPSSGCSVFFRPPCKHVFVANSCTDQHAVMWQNSLYIGAHGIHIRMHISNVSCFPGPLVDNA